MPGMDVTPAFQMHCHNYRTPKRFAGQTVLVVGASFSGLHTFLGHDIFKARVMLSFASA